MKAQTNFQQTDVRVNEQADAPAGEFSRRSAELNDLLCILNVLTWDARTQRPSGGCEASTASRIGWSSPVSAR